MVPAVHAHQDVVVEELARLFAVEPDPADLRREVDDGVDALHDARAGRRVPQIGLSRARRHRDGALLAKPGDDTATQEAVAAGDEDLLALEVHRCTPRFELPVATA